MSTLDIFFHSLGTAVVASPVLLLAVLGLSLLVNRPFSETATVRLTQMSVLLSLLPAIAILIAMLATGIRNVPIEFGNWVTIPEQAFHFHLKFTFDRLSIPFLMLSCVLCGVVGEFSRRYLHREQGFARFFLFYAIFYCGMVLSSLAGTIETLFVGWEMVGLSSALLIAYFHERENPVRNGQRVWTIYRLSDAALLIAAITMHHMVGEGDFGGLMSSGIWPEGTAAVTPSQALLVGTLLLIGAAGKSALFPFSGWLPRAMEGPTPSSAIFYGALSVHLGAYLLLRLSPLIEASLALQMMVLSLGAISAVGGALMSRVQNDVKTSLAYASLTQVGIIVVEIGLGLRYLALIHIMGHATLRTMQLLRAPTLLRDYNDLENKIGSRLKQPSWSGVRWLPQSAQRWCYRFGFDRGFMDIALDRWVAGPFVKCFRTCNEWEHRITCWLSREPDANTEEGSPDLANDTSQDISTAA
ncbi:proton-conducting transporter transmembrane domain-containing protein [Rhodopirellula sp. P2]|uniref:proton-conducting transporter transmembrane domain-containing protein n=1 Tax=Rhodopirellula sp. P2 TaxID=2127060 RepID=UPI002368531C|nr:proton-conducting transporter membrane subunit [Rhodopirellula sp. P2]WDQ17536.1 proton-conducting transporter membrane subunit [Rhodopirellula sp. P2]